MKIVVQENRIDENGNKHLYIEYDKQLPDGTPYSEKLYYTDNGVPEVPVDEIGTLKEEIETLKNLVADLTSLVLEV